MMKRCPNCSHENKDTANFCIRCGTPLDKRCPRCGNAVEEDALFCPVCGARLDGKKPCPACGTINDPDAAFCEKCGTALSDGGRVASTAPAVPNYAPNYTPGTPVPARNAPAFVPAPPAGTAAPVPVAAPKKKSSGEKKRLIARVLEIVRAGAVLGLAFLLFVLSFFGVGKLSASSMLSSETDMDDETAMIFSMMGDLEISSLDVIEGAFAWSDPVSGEERMQDFALYMMENLDPEIIAGLENGSASSVIALIPAIVDVAEDYNILKLAAMEETVQYAPNGVMDLWIAAVFCLAYILLSAAFLATAAVDLAFTLRRKKGLKATMRLSLFSFASLLFVAFYLRGVFSPGWGGMAGAGIAAIVIVLAAVVVDFVLRLLADKMTGTAEKTRLSRVFRRITAGAGAALSLIVLVLAGSAAVSVVCSVDSVSVLAFRGGYSASSLSNAWGMLLSAQDNPDLYGTAGTGIPGAFASLYSSIRGELLAPSNMGVLGNAAVEIPFAIIGVCADVCVAAAVVTGVLALANGISSASSGKKPSLVYPVLLLVFTLLIAVLSGICCGFANEGLSDVPGIQYTAKLAAAPVVAVVLAAVNLAQRITLGAIGRKREKAEAENEKTPSDETQTAGAGM